MANSLRGEQGRAHRLNRLDILSKLQSPLKGSTNDNLDKGGTNDQTIIT
eukprot:CAMPEP_0167833302 /NCGR_PEP_ID=MMETSP0112_2-20121227/14924_1 /TAXON_ID=91324 /ORGANISM="Lotharella globosa, Strain CCCM811" /LENGTH=48 /DNA_ID= /DNA_START= /DNA_END= /DNA_ORIENTATION=